VPTDIIIERQTTLKTFKGNAGAYMAEEYSIDLAVFLTTIDVIGY
jgi:hypothetical protein